MRQLAGLRGKYEACFLFLLLMIVEWVIPGPASLAQITPHPFWLPVVLLSVQYGSGTGLIVAALATGLSWVAGWPVQSAQEDFYTYSLRVWREPVLWISAAIVIGGLRNRQIQERFALEERLHLTERQRDTIADFSRELQEDITVHERRAATVRAGSVEAALEALQRLRAANEAEMMPLLREAVREWLGDARWRLHPLQGGELCHADQPVPDVVFLVRTALVYAVATQRPRVFSVFDEQEAGLLDGVGIFACPVRPIEGGPYHGLFVVETVSPERLVPATAGAVQVIASALGQAFDRANRNAEAAQNVRFSARADAREPAELNSLHGHGATVGDVSCPR